MHTQRHLLLYSCDVPHAAYRPIGEFQLPKGHKKRNQKFLKLLKNFRKTFKINIGQLECTERFL